MRRAERTRSASATRLIARIMVVSTRMFLSLTAETSTPLYGTVSACFRLFGLVWENKRAFSFPFRQTQDVAKEIMLLQDNLLKETMVSSKKLSWPDVVSSDRREVSNTIWTTKHNFRLRLLHLLLRKSLAQLRSIEPEFTFAYQSAVRLHKAASTFLPASSRSCNTSSNVA